MNETFVKPKYDAGGFAGIPARITQAFASKQYDAVVLFFIDAFGWRFYERFREAKFIQRFERNGQIEKLTSQFPSTTAAHVTTIHTGLPVGASGVHEWYYYEPQVDRVIAPLLFSFAGSKERDMLKNKISPEALYPAGTFYPELKKMGVDCFNFGQREFTPSTYSKVVMKPSEIRPYKTLSEALVNIGQLLEKQTKPAYLHLYFDKIDGVAHEYGPTAPQTEAEIETFLLLMEHFFERVFLRQGKKVLFLMTADHGMCEVDPKTTIYLNTNPNFRGVERFIRENRKGEALVPAGSPRDLFLYVKDRLLDEAQDFLAQRLKDKADVAKTETLIKEGYFGLEISARFRERVANLVILPYRYESVWWYDKDKYVQRYYGHHGGLTPQEMETVLYSLEL
ncbi:MAG: alkaline phosphatase family protein [Anaerolineales bacterium]|nr:alkaline phosphatase family protein [Anaerolineales bacterium]